MIIDNKSYVNTTLTRIKADMIGPTVTEALGRLLGNNLKAAAA